MLKKKKDVDLGKLVKKEMSMKQMEIDKPRREMKEFKKSEHLTIEESQGIS